MAVDEELRFPFGKLSSQIELDDEDLFYFQNLPELTENTQQQMLMETEI